MKAGVTTSVIAHAALLIIAIVGLGSAKPLQPEVVESIAVDLVPISDVTNIRAGSLQSKVVKTDTPAIVETEKPAQLAQKAGNTEEDQPTPQETAKVTPAPVVNTAPDPTPAPQPTKEPDPVKTPTPTPQPVAAPDPAPSPVEAQPQQEVAADTGDTPAQAVAPMPASRPAQLQKAPVKPTPTKTAEVTPKKDPTPKTQTDQSQKKPDPQAKPADQVAELINSEKSRGAVNGAGGSPTLGKTSGKASTLSQSEMDGLSAAMRACFSPPPGSADENATAVIVVRLDRSGMVMDAEVQSVSGASTGTMTGNAAIRAVKRCGQNGYTMLPPEKYDGDTGWNTVNVTFNASDVG